MGVALLAHCISFFSMAYFDRTIFYFFWLLSAIAAGTMEGNWLICDRPGRSFRGVASQRQPGAPSEARGRGVKSSGVIRVFTGKGLPAGLWTSVAVAHFQIGSLGGRSDLTSEMVRQV